MTIFVTALHVLVCLILVVLVLLQKGKGAEIGAVFGGASATTIFGSAGAGTFLTKLTTWSAVVFMVTSFYLAYVALNTDDASTFAKPPAAEAQSQTPAAQKTPAADFVEVMDAAPPAGAAPSAPASDVVNASSPAPASAQSAPAERGAAPAEKAPVSPAPSHSPQ